MLIEKITLNNFRIYKGENCLCFSIDPEHNVSIVAGNNGYGKTSLLTSLVWCLYGKLMVDVDDRYRREIYESGGYKRYCEKIMNRAALEEYEGKYQALSQNLDNTSAIDKRLLTRKIQNLQSFSVSIQFTNIFIPSVPCDELIVKRTYNVIAHHEEIEILIDGRPNELTQSVGENIFINDFILPKEIAKFFFFDAEKIVSLAEIRTTEEKMDLSRAYAEVLGLKKYVDLKENLENLRLRLRRKNSGKGDEEKLDKLKKQQKQQTSLIEHTTNLLTEKKQELVSKKLLSDKLQEQLIREGSVLSLEELKDFKALREALSEEGRKLKARLQEMMELVPLAIAADKLKTVKAQLDQEQVHAHHHITTALLEKKLAEIKDSLRQNKRVFNLDKETERKLLTLIEQNLLSEQPEEFNLLLHFTSEQFNRFHSVYANLAGSFSKTFRQLIADQKKQQSALLIVQRKLSDAETKENDPVIQRIRKDKADVEESIKKEEAAIIQLEAQLIQAQNEQASIAKVINELAKNIAVDQADKQKDSIAERLIGELSAFIKELKTKKKASLEVKIQTELNRLMHKSAFVKRVEVIIEGDLIEIELYDSTGKAINKDGLSKGEQQLYATSLLKALIDESNIQFPVFIDSPLQKFDKEHSKNIIKEFYPAVAGQVILFPLLEKELSETEYNWLLPQLANTYLIRNIEQYRSEFFEVKPAELFKSIQRTENVYQY